MRRILLALFALLGVYLVWRLIVMRTKSGVDLTGVSWRMFVASLLIEPIFKLYGSDLVITSGVDGTHKANSLHYQGLALDYRTHDLPIDQVQTVAAKVLTVLAPLGYDVVLEGDHLHIEYDPHT